MKAILKARPLFLLLLPLFFVFHGYVENFGLIPVKDVSVLFLIYLGASIALAGLLWLVFRNMIKACIIAFLLMAFYFFFGAIYDSIMSLSPGSFFSKYSVILAAFFLFVTVCFVLLFRYRKPLTKLNYTLNVFLCLLLIVDGAWLVYKLVDRKPFSDSSLQKQISICDTCSRPDIYLIMADEYAGDQALLETMNFDNSGFKEQLKDRGFYSPVSRSNYNFTPFSVASMLNMDYLQGLEGKNSSHRDLAICYDLIRECKAFQFLFYHGYELHNFSIFDVYDQPSLIKSTILPEKTRFITSQTLFRRLDNNILFNMAAKFGTGFLKRRFYLPYHSNIKTLDSLQALIPQKTGKPKFVYTHLVMPHYPYFFDKEGKERVFTDLSSAQERNIPHYIEYLQYTNKVLLKMIDQIIANSPTPPVIILVSDHGFREYPMPVNVKYRFMNLLSIYTPGKNYKAFYDGMSNVNLFRAMFNQEFAQRFPLLKDSTSYIQP